MSLKMSRKYLLKYNHKYAIERQNLQFKFADVLLGTKLLKSGETA